IRHQEAGRNVPMYRTSTACALAGRIGGDMVVSMRPIPAAQVAEAVRITDRFPAVHGAPVHIGDPGRISIDDLDSPDFGDPPVIAAGDIPVFCACGVTPQAAIRDSAVPFAITHSPGRMFITDEPEDTYRRCPLLHCPPTPPPPAHSSSEARTATRRHRRTGAATPAD